MRAEVYKTLRFNTIVNLLDSSILGMGVGLSSMVTVLPLFISTMTDSPVLIGLIPAINSLGFQLPQLFIARWVSRQKQVKPLVLGLTILERMPYLGLAILAFLYNESNTQMILILSFSLLIIQGLGAGLAGNPWQIMIGKIIPSERRGMFFGMAEGLLNLLGGVGAVIAGQILGRITGSTGFGWCFLLTAGLMLISWVFLGMTREPTMIITNEGAPPAVGFSKNLFLILRKDQSFRWFLAAKIASQLSLMGYAYYSIYAVNYYGVSKIEIGWMTGVLMGTNFITNILMGWFGDRKGHRQMMILGLLALVLSALTAWLAPGPAWFYMVFTLAAVGNVAIWTVSLSMTLEYGTEEERPVYVGLANTLVAPINFLTPLLGGFLALQFGYQLVFIASVFGGLVAVGILLLKVSDHPKLVPESII